MLNANRGHVNYIVFFVLGSRTFDDHLHVQECALIFADSYRKYWTVFCIKRVNIPTFSGNILGVQVRRIE